MDPGKEQRRRLEFDEEPSGETGRDVGRLREEVLPSKRSNDPGKQPKNATRTAAPGKPRSGSDSDASRRSRGH
jgi:hypothetical protein